jgi:hypothetical protein
LHLSLPILSSNAYIPSIFEERRKGFMAGFKIPTCNLKVCEASSVLTGYLLKLFQSWVKEWFQPSGKITRSDLTLLALKKLEYSSWISRKITCSDIDCSFVVIPFAFYLYKPKAKVVKYKVSKDTVEILNSIVDSSLLGDLTINCDGCDLWIPEDPIAGDSAIIPGVILALLFSHAQLVEPDTFELEVSRPSVPDFKTAYVTLPIAVSKCEVSQGDILNTIASDYITRVNVSYDGSKLVFRRNVISSEFVNFCDGAITATAFENTHYLNNIKITKSQKESSEVVKD